VTELKVSLVSLVLAVTNLAAQQPSPLFIRLPTGDSMPADTYGRGNRGGDDRPRLPGIEDQFARLPGPKEMVVLEGSAHGQRIFGTPAGVLLMRQVLRALAGR